ncbi:MAG: FCD domain-containing protein, partial [Micromonosporaceae bacterium]
FRGLEGQLFLAISLDDAGFGDLTEVAREHLPLIEAIDSGDEHLAAARIQEHILSTIELTVERLGGTPTDLLTLNRS